MMFLDLADEYVGMRLVNPHTKKHVLQIARQFVERSSAIKVHDINRMTLIRYKNEALKSIKPVTFNGNLKYLRLITQYGVEVGHLTQNPFDELKLIPVGEIPRKTLDLSEIESLDTQLSQEVELDQQGWFWHAVIRCFYYTGMRRRQLVNLRVSDLDFKNEILRLSYQGSKTRREWFVPMHPKLGETFTELIHRTEEIRGRKLSQNDYVFRAFDLFPRYKSDSVGRMKPESITSYFKRLNKKEQISVGAHRFRHTFATELCNPKDDTPPDIFAVQQLLGHSDLKTTRMYVKTRISRLTNVVMQINQLGGRKE